MITLRSRTGSTFSTVLIALVVGAFAGALLTWLLLDRPPLLSSGAGAAIERDDDTRRSPDPAHDGGPRDEAYIARKLREWNLDAESLRQELDRAGRILREKSREIGSRVAEETSDVRIIAVIKAKFTLDDELSAWDISVGCREGHVTLTGTVDSPEKIGRAIVLALDTKGVVDVDSSLRVRPKSA